jgi:hypothetical protein
MGAKFIKASILEIYDKKNNSEKFDNTVDTTRIN